MDQNKQSDFLKIAFDARPLLTSYAYSLLKDWSLAQDIFQDAVISMNEKCHDITNPNPLAWLKQVIRNKSIDLIRKQERSNKLNDQFIVLIDKKFDALLKQDEIELHKEKDKALQLCMAKLELSSRQIILEFYKSKTSCLKLAEIYKKSTNAIRLTLSRSRSQLRHCVKNTLTES